MLIEYVDGDHTAENLTYGVRALYWYDQDAGRKAAANVLAGPRAEQLRSGDRYQLEAMAKQKRGD